MLHTELFIFQTNIHLLYNNGYVFVAVAPNEHISSVTIIKHCYNYKTLLQLQNINQTHNAHSSTTENSQITTDTFEELIGKTEKMSFSSRSESRDRNRIADLLWKRVPRGRRTRKTIDHTSCKCYILINKYKTTAYHHTILVLYNSVHQ